MKTRKWISKLFTLFIIVPCFLIVSCDRKDKRTDVTECKLVGTLQHLQYWNKYDDWDLSSLQLRITYSDNSICNLDADSKFITYHFTPRSPSGLKPGVISLKITNSYYTDSSGKKHSIPDEEFNNISIINYPYSGTARELYDSGILVKYIVPSFIGLVFITTLVIMIIKKKKT